MNAEIRQLLRRLECVKHIFLQKSFASFASKSKKEI